MRTLDSWDGVFASFARSLEAPHGAVGAVGRVVAEAEAALDANRDALTAFWTSDKLFQKLLKRAYGYDNDASWLTLVARQGREAEARAVLALLSPSGRLLAAAHAADARHAVQFLFPPERLPAHTQELLKSPADWRELERWPQYRGSLRVDAGAPPWMGSMLRQTME
jgi:hypothetical protein